LNLHLFPLLSPHFYLPPFNLKKKISSRKNIGEGANFPPPSYALGYIYGVIIVYWFIIVATEKL